MRRFYSPIPYRVIKEYRVKRALYDIARSLNINSRVVIEDAYRALQDARFGLDNVTTVTAIALWLAARSRGYNVTFDDIKPFIDRDPHYFSKYVIPLAQRFKVTASSIVQNYVFKLAGKCSTDYKTVMKAVDLGEKLRRFGLMPKAAAYIASYIIFNIKGYRLRISDIKRCININGYSISKQFMKVESVEVELG